MDELSIIACSLESLAADISKAKGVAFVLGDSMAEGSGGESDMCVEVVRLLYGMLDTAVEDLDVLAQQAFDIVRKGS